MNLSLLIPISAIMLVNVFDSMLVNGGAAGTKRKDWKMGTENGVLYDGDGMGSLCYSEKDLINSEDTCNRVANSGLIGYSNYLNKALRKNVAGMPNGCSAFKDGTPIFNNAATGLGTKNSEATPLCHKKTPNPQCQSNADCTDSYRKHCQGNQCVPNCECNVRGRLTKAGEPDYCYMKEIPCLTKTSWFNENLLWITCKYEGQVEVDCVDGIGF